MEHFTTKHLFYQVIYKYSCDALYYVITQYNIYYYNIVFTRFKTLCLQAYNLFGNNNVNVKFYKKSFF